MPVRHVADGLFIACCPVRCNGTASPVDLQVQHNAEPLTIHSLALPTPWNEGRKGDVMCLMNEQQPLPATYNCVMTLIVVYCITIVVSTRALESTRPTVVRQSFLE